MTYAVTERSTTALGQVEEFRRIARTICGRSDGEGVRTAANALITGQARADEALAAVIARSGRQLPPGFDPMLRHVGLDPDVVLGLSLLARGPGLGVLRDAEQAVGLQIAHVNLMAQDMTWVSLGDARSSWRAKEMLVPAIPEVARVALTGRPLAMLLTHPVLDAMNLTITAFHDCWSDPTMMEVVTSIHPHDPD